MTEVSSHRAQPTPLVELCVSKLAQVLIRYGPKKVRFSLLTELPHTVLESLIDTLVTRNALNDNVLLHALTRRTQKLGLEGAVQVRRCFLNTVGRSCPSLQVLDVRGCHQVDNRIVRDVLQCCEDLSILRLDGCTKISDSAFAPGLWKPPLVGLLGLRELSVARCGQITAEGLLGSVMKCTPLLRTLGLENCRSAVTDDVAAELLFSFGLESLDLSACSQVTDAPFVERPTTTLRELRLASTCISDAAIEGIAKRSPHLEVVDVGYVMKFTDSGMWSLTRYCTKLRDVCVSHTQVTDKAFEALVQCEHLQRLDASWCLRPTVAALEILSLPTTRPPLREFIFDHLGALNLGLAMLPPALHREAKSEKSASLRSPGLTPASPPRSLRSLSCDIPSTWSLPAAALSTERQAPKFLEAPVGNSMLESNPATPQRTFEPLPSLQLLAVAYAGEIQALLLEGMHSIVSAAALDAIASNCHNLQQLALTLQDHKDSDAAMEAGFKAISSSCPWLWLLSLDSSAKPHQLLTSSLALPHFGHLRSLSLCCCSKTGGLTDQQLETILSGRETLQTLSLRGCEGLTDSLFPSWSTRHERHEGGPVAIDELDQALLSWGPLGFEQPKKSSIADVFDFKADPFDFKPEPRLSTGGQQPQQQPRQQHHRGARCPAAAALRTVRNLSLTGAVAMTDESGSALADLMREAQTVDLRGCHFLSEATLRMFQKLCRSLRSISITTRDRSLTWSSASKEKKRHTRKPTWVHSESSATESN